MEGLSARRWNPGFVALRWRHLFWMLPLLGLLTGVAWFLLQQFKETTVSGSFAYSCGRTPAASNEAVAREGMAFMTSKMVFENAASRAARSKTWGMSADVDDIRSRQKVEVDSAMGLPAIRMTVAGRGEKAAHETWMAIYNAAWEIAIEEQLELEQTQLDATKRKVIRLEGEVAALEQASVTPASFAGGPAHKLSGNRDVKGVLSELDDARKEQKRLEMNQWCGTSFFERVGMISPPHLSVPALPLGPMGMLGIHGASGFGAGLFAAVFLGYLLEFLKPRRFVPPAENLVEGHDF